MRIIDTNYNLNGTVDTNIVHISDIHYYNKKCIKRLNKILEKIKKIKPNYICITGDITDESRVYNEEIFLDWLTKLASISKVIICLGNHEYYLNCEKNIFGLNYELMDKIKKIKNIYLLNNENKKIDKINFIGLNLTFEHYMSNNECNESFKKYIKYVKTDKNCYNVLLCHTPSNIIDNINELNCELVLSGHMHGGIMPHIFRKIFKNRGLISPQKKLFPKNIYGHIKINNKNLIITSGVVVFSHFNNFRFLNTFFAPEIVNIKVKK